MNTGFHISLGAETLWIIGDPLVLIVRRGERNAEVSFLNGGHFSSSDCNATAEQAREFLPESLHYLTTPHGLTLWQATQ